jgi:hypothetical protein
MSTAYAETLVIAVGRMRLSREEALEIAKGLERIAETTTVLHIAQAARNEAARLQATWAGER